MPAKTYPIECDLPMLEMIAFAVETMAQMLQDDIDRGGGCGCGNKKLPVSRLRKDLQTSQRIIAQAIRGQVNLEVVTHANRKRKKVSKR